MYSPRSNKSLWVSLEVSVALSLATWLAWTAELPGDYGIYLVIVLAALSVCFILKTLTHLVVAAFGSAARSGGRLLGQSWAVFKHELESD